MRLYQVVNKSGSVPFDGKYGLSIFKTEGEAKDFVDYLYDECGMIDCLFGINDIVRISDISL